MLRFFLRGTRLHAGITTRKFFDASCGVDKLLLARKERMARCANAHFDVGTCRTCAICGAARAMNGGLVVFGVNICFHGQKREVDSIPVASDGK